MKSINAFCFEIFVAKIYSSLNSFFLMFYFPFLYICFLLSGLLFLKAFLNESVNSRMKPSFDVFPYVPYIVPDIARYLLES